MASSFVPAALAGGIEGRFARRHDVTLDGLRPQRMAGDRDDFCIDEAGRFLGNTGGRPMFDILNEHWCDFVAQGRITNAEYERMTLPQYYNSVEEFTRPLLEASSEPHRAGLRLEHVETRIVGCPFAAEFARHGDAARFARDYIPTIRSWNESIFAAALSPDRNKEEHRGIIDAYYNAYESRVREAPEGHGMDYVHVYLTIRKDEAGE